MFYFFFDDLKLCLNIRSPHVISVLFGSSCFTFRLFLLFSVGFRALPPVSFHGWLFIVHLASTMVRRTLLLPPLCCLFHSCSKRRSTVVTKEVNKQLAALRSIRRSPYAAELLRLNGFEPPYHLDPPASPRPYVARTVVPIAQELT